MRDERRQALEHPSQRGLFWGADKWAGTHQAHKSQWLVPVVLVGPVSQPVGSLLPTQLLQTESPFHMVTWPHFSTCSSHPSIPSSIVSSSSLSLVSCSSLYPPGRAHHCTLISGCRREPGHMQQSSLQLSGSPCRRIQSTGGRSPPPSKWEDL